MATCSRSAALAPPTVQSGIVSQHSLHLNALDVSLLELVAVILGLLCVGLTVRQHIACWPTGLAMVTLYIFIFFQARLYSDMLLQVVYVFLQIYGWWAWRRGGPEHSPLSVSRMRGAVIVGAAAACVAGTCVWGYLMARFTDASFPFTDAFTTVASLIAQVLMSRKKLESWLIWILVDFVSIGLYFRKELYLTMGLYAAFLILAAMGYGAWKKSLHGATASA